MTGTHLPPRRRAAKRTAMKPPRPILAEPGPLAAIIVVGGVIAALAPFDRGFAALTAGSAGGRAGLLVAMAVVGSAAAARLGLRLTGHGAKSPVGVGLAAAMAMAAYCLTIDCWMLRAQVDPAVARFLHEPLGNRLVYFMPRAFNENVIYRLFVFPVLALGCKPCGEARDGAGACRSGCCSPRW